MHQTRCKDDLGHVWSMKTQTASVIEALLNSSVPESLGCAGFPACLQCTAQTVPPTPLPLVSPILSTIETDPVQAISRGNLPRSLFYVEVLLYVRPKLATHWLLEALQDCPEDCLEC